MTSADLVPNTNNTQYILVGTVIVGKNSTTNLDEIKTVHSVCSVALNPCLLDWTSGQ
jgi:hypothetical protein